MVAVSSSVQVAFACASVAMLLVTAVAIPLFLVRIPSDYFARPHPQRPLWLRVLRSLVGVVFILLGVAMIVLPGQGVLTILVGIAILDVPLRERVVHRVLRMPRVHGAIDRLRRRAGKAPLVIPPSASDERYRARAAA